MLGKSKNSVDEQPPPPPTEWTWCQTERCQSQRVRSVSSEIFIIEIFFVDPSFSILKSQSSDTSPLSIGHHIKFVPPAYMRTKNLTYTYIHESRKLRAVHAQCSCCYQYIEAVRMSRAGPLLTGSRLTYSFDTFLKLHSYGVGRPGLARSAFNELI